MMNVERRMRTIHSMNLPLSRMTWQLSENSSVLNVFSRLK